MAQENIETQTPENDIEMVDQLIHHDIVEAIYDHRMPPGTRLSEAGLGELYDVSRTVARKALYRLASDKLVDIRPNRGAIVHEPTVEEARQVFEARRFVETSLLRKTIPAMSAGDRQYLRELEAGELAAHKSDDRQRIIRASGDFHRGLATLSGNEPLCKFLDQLIGQTSLIIAMYQPRVLSACPSHAHCNLINIFMEADVEHAQKAMWTHLLECENELNLGAAPEHKNLAAMLNASPTTRN